MLLTLAWLSIALAGVCALLIAWDEVRHPQSMGVMNIVWPVSALYFSVLALWAYHSWGRATTHPGMKDSPAPDPAGDDRKGEGSAHAEHVAHRARPSLYQVAIGTSHCGAGCMLADVAAEFAIAAAGITLLGSVLWAEFAIDFAAAWSLGIVFQYFAIQPMRHLPVGQGVAAAAKADTLSILAFQVGMYGWMAFTYFVLFPRPHLTPFDPRYWLMMQAGMICGYATSFPVNWLLIRGGLKEAM